MEDDDEVMGPPGRPSCCPGGVSHLGKVEVGGDGSGPGTARPASPAPRQRTDPEHAQPSTSCVNATTPECMKCGSNITEDEFQPFMPSGKKHSQVFWHVLRGSMSNLPAMPTNTVRIFLSSTFSDFKAERNYLIQHAYPQLEEFCATHGVDFHVLDMRWGVTDDVVNDHQVAPLCISEIITCQKLSFGPSFVVLLGDRYGWQGFPPRIDIKEFTTLLAEAQTDAETELLGTWFKRDDNAVPPEYILQPIHVNFKHFDCAKREADRAAWTEVSEKLQNILRSCARAAKEKGTFTEEEKQKYFISVTEEEIRQGVHQSDDPTSSVMCYKRSLKGIDQAPVTENLNKFIDCRNKPKVIDKEAKSLRKNLQEKLQPLLPPSNIQQYQINWTDVPLEVSPEEEHKAYLKKFGEDFTNDVKKLVSEKVVANLKMCDDTKLMALYHEVLHHAHFAQMKCQVFCGRKGEIARIKEYLAKGKTGGHHPLIVHGVSGIGKTALMAYIASKLHDWFGSNCFSVLRFLGTSPLSSNISETLRSTIEQLSLLFGLRVPSECSMEMFGHIRRVLHALLEKVSQQTTGIMVLMLDSVDQLSTANGAHRMVWLPKVLPKNVYVIVSMLTQDCMDTLSYTRKRVKDEADYLEVSPLSEYTGECIIDYHLTHNKRRLTAEQQELVLNAFKTLRHPLFLKLVIDEAKVWTSYLQQSTLPILRPKCAADDAVKAAIMKRFESMEMKYGVTFVRHALGYLTCGNGGLTEIEIEDVLSCDDEVLNEVYQYHEPPLEGVVRIPSLMWARLENALKEYICERRVDGKVVLAWYHRQFWEAAEMRYLQPESKKQERHDMLANLFLQETGMKKTITLHYFQDKPITDADRRVKPQPLEVTNLRKLNAVPYHMYHSGKHKKLITTCLINYEWLLLQLRAFSINCVIRDLEVMDVHPDVAFFRKVLENCFDALRKDPYLLAYNIVERLECCFQGNEVLEAIVADARKWLATAVVPLLVPTHPIQLQKANSPQLFSIMLGYDGVLTTDGSTVCSWSETMIQTLCLKTRDIIGSVKIAKPAPLQILSDNQHFVFAEDNQIAKYEMDTGDVVANIPMYEGEYEKVSIRCLTASNNCRLAAVGIKFGKPKNQRSWQNKCIICLVDLEEERVIERTTHFSGKKPVDNLFFVQNDQVIIGTSKNMIHVYSVPSLSIKSQFPRSDDLHGNTFQKFPDKNLIVGLSSSGKEVKIVLFDYSQMDVRTSENVHIDGDQKMAVPFGMHCKKDLSSFLVGSSGNAAKERLSSICIWGPSEGKADAYVKIPLQPRGTKAANSLVATDDWRYALVGWQCGYIAVIDLKLGQDLQGITAHGHAVNLMKILSDGKTLITASQDHTLKVWDLPGLLQKAQIVDGREAPSEDLRCLHEKEQCLCLIACDQFIVSVPQSCWQAPQFWSYDNGHLLAELTEAHQELYAKSVENNKLDFPMDMHGIVTELPGEVLVYERKRRDALTILVTQGYKNPKVLVHHRFENTFFRLIIQHQQQSVLYAVHDGLLGIYNITTLQPLKQITMPPISKDVGRIDSSNGKKRLMSYKVAATLDERYFLIVNPAGPSGKYMDIIDIQEHKYKLRVPLIKYIPLKFLSDGVYFLCEDENGELRCYPAHKCLQNIRERGRDYDYRNLVFTVEFLSKDRCLGCSIDNKTHTIHVWQVEPLEMLHNLHGHEHEVMSVDISPDNRFLVSGSYDNSVRVWSLMTGTQMCMFHMFEAVEKVQFSLSMTHVAVQSCCAPQSKRGVSLALKNICL